MARNLVERLKAAMSPRARVTDTAALLTDLKAEQARLENARDQAAAESVDFTLSEDDREEAAAKAGRLDRTIKGLDVEIAKVAALLEERRSDEARRAKEAERRAALTERDELAARFAQRVPAITTELIEIFKAVQANAERMRIAGLHEANAEFHARGIPGNGYVNNTPAEAFLKIKIPAFKGHGRAWPVDYLEEMNRKVAADHSELLRRNRETLDRQARERAEAAAKFAREHGTYRLTVDATGDAERIARIPEELAIGNIPPSLGCWDFRDLTISHEHAEKLKAVPRLKVELVGEARK